jgi:2,3,4,5-tetrahydropyridine-2-carboxylate N-succinyltransferase
MLEIQREIDRLMELTAEEARGEGQAVVSEFRDGLNRGRYRAAEKINGVWHTHAWVKRGILLAFRIGANIDRDLSEEFRFRDKNTLPLRRRMDTNPRVVPGGSSIRDGAYIGSNVVCMPPMFINIGAWVGDETMIDSHALVGSCAQIGNRVHLSAAAQIGGVLEPPGALPVIVEDGAFIGGNCGVYEGVIVGEHAVLAPGVLLTGGVRVYDTVRREVYQRAGENPLTIPPGAVLVPGSRRASGTFAEQNGLSLYAPIIVKYRDEGTDAATSLEEILR